MKSKIILEDLKIYAYHGVLPEENLIGTYYLINAEFETDLWKAADTDNLNDTVSYAEINDFIHEEMSRPSKLLENVAGRIIEGIGKKFPQILAVKLTIMKTSPPIKGECKGASVYFERQY